MPANLRCSYWRRVTRAMHRIGNRGNRGEDGSIVLVLLLIMFLSIIAVTVTTGALTQLNLSTNLKLRNDALQGALAGNQAAVAEIRSAASGGNLTVSQLPCTTVAGVTNSTAGTPYTATIQYQQQNSQGQYAGVSCTPGVGPITTSHSFLARAIITSCAPANVCPAVGSAAPNTGWRRTISTYTFKTTNANIPGGLVNTYQFGECMVASFNNGTDPSGGMTLDVTTSCGPASSSYTLEKFQYTSTWNLEIIVGGQGYCVQDPEDLSSPKSSPIVFGTCGANPTYQWGIDDTAEIRGVATNGSGQPTNWCINNPLGDTQPAPQTVQTSPAFMAACAGGYDNKYTWQMAPSVGAGGAAPSDTTTLFGNTNQLVNYQEFGRCMDVTNQYVGSSFLIDYSCKQFPDTADYPTWNQRWCFTQHSIDSNGNPVGVLYTPQGQTSCASPSNPYCAQSPLETPVQAVDAWVTVVPCSPSSATQPTALSWTGWSIRGGAIHDYTWTDASGYCLEANTQNPQYPSGSSNEWSTIQVATCDGSYMQKWNAPATLGSSQIADTHEG